MRTTSLFCSLYIFIENCIIKSLHLLIFIDPIENPKGRLDLLLLVCLLVCSLANFLKDDATELIKILHDDAEGLV